ncbi:asparaginase [soil metagenome]
MTVVVEVVRNGFVESVHHVSVAAVDPAGRCVLSAGDPDRPVLPRSANKPLQAVAMLRSGLALEGADLALAAASHSGEPRHVERVRGLLARGGFGEEDLQCPAQLPIDDVEAAAVLRAGGMPSRVLMNCSGKHAAMLLTCQVAGWSVTDYLAETHPLQQEVRRVVEELAAEPVTATGVDGCGAPLFAISLLGVARAFAAMVRATPGTPARLVADAMRAYPEMVAGHRREDTQLMRAVPGLLMKGGAEGVHAAALADGSAVAIKVEDGAVRARMPVLVEVLRRLGATGYSRLGAGGDSRLGVGGDVLDEHASTVVLGGGAPVGAVRLPAGAFDRPRAAPPVPEAPRES